MMNKVVKEKVPKILQPHLPEEHSCCVQGCGAVQYNDLREDVYENHVQIQTGVTTIAVTQGKPSVTRWAVKTTQGAISLHHWLETQNEQLCDLVAIWWKFRQSLEQLNLQNDCNWA